MGKYNYNDLKINLQKRGLKLLTKENEYKNLKQKVIISNGKYKTYICPEQFMYKDKEISPYWFSKNNPFILDNINNYLLNEKNGNFICLSSEYINRDSLLDFQCTRCGYKFKLSWFNARRNEDNHRGIICEYCDGRLESLHASILKQMFLHYYPDTIVEDPSCINPITNAIMPTDIVNHRLKIAIEVQGQFHERKEQKIKDKIKKEFWINKGYSFYDYKIDGVSILDYIKLFFPEIIQIPDWINYNYSNKLNVHKAQILLNNGMKISEIAKELNVPEHRVYDSIYSKKLFYPDGYNKNNNVSVVKLNLNKEYICTYDSYREAEKENNIKLGVITSTIFEKRYYAKGFYWIPENLYLSNNYIIPTRRDEKFEVPVIQYDMNDCYIQTYETIKEAAKDINVISYKIYEVASGKRKSVKGFKYKFLTN
jgi:hypothetical protein